MKPVVKVVQRQTPMMVAVPHAAHSSVTNLMLHGGQAAI